MMAGIKCVVFLAVLTFHLTLTRGDTEVSCVFMERCILPCSFETGADVVIHWNEVSTGDIRAHSFYYNQDQLGNQDQHFRNRTSLFKDKISKGNASLQLTGVRVQDEGRYKCYTSTIRGNKESFINLKIDAPVHKVNIQQVTNRITCSSEGIYPKPELTWSTSPPSNITSNNTTVQQTEQQLYYISSSLMLLESQNDSVYTCSIKTRKHTWRASLRNLSVILNDSMKMTIPCAASYTSIRGFSLLWKFNHSQIILNQNRTDAHYTVSEEWREQVKTVSESGSLTLQKLTSDQQGTYTCELRNTKETCITDTIVKITEDHPISVPVIVLVIVVPFVIILVALLGFLIYRRVRNNASIL